MIEIEKIFGTEGIFPCAVPSGRPPPGKPPPPSFPTALAGDGVVAATPGHSTTPLLWELRAQQHIRLLSPTRCQGHSICGCGCLGVGVHACASGFDFGHKPVPDLPDDHPANRCNDGYNQWCVSGVTTLIFFAFILTKDIILGNKPWGFCINLYKPPGPTPLSARHSIAGGSKYH